MSKGESLGKDWIIENGSRFTAAYKGQTFHATATVADGSTTFRIDGIPGVAFATLSGAGKHITGSAVNGFRFWVQGEERVIGRTPKAEGTTATTEGGDAAEAKPKAEKPKRVAKPKPIIYRAKSQKNCPEGQERWYCNACAEAFYVPTDAAPESCPKGHNNQPPASEELTSDDVVADVEGVVEEAEVVEDAEEAELLPTL